MKPSEQQETIFELSEIIVGLKADRASLRQELHTKNALIRDLAQQLEEHKTRLRPKKRVRKVRVSSEASRLAAKLKRCGVAR